MNVTDVIKLKALMLINDEHGYILPGECFYPGFTKNCITGRMMSHGPMIGWTKIGDPESLAAKFVKERKACYV